MLAPRSDRRWLIALAVELAADCATEHVWGSRLTRIEVGRSVEFRHEIVSAGRSPARRVVTVLDLLRLSAQQALAYSR